uniref:hypothetical protein n=1 Tax=Mycolicibacterium wolinskyi TaxID=59750 RepID=UPI0035AB9361
MHAGHKVRHVTAADLVETLYRGLADNTVGKTIESLLRVDPKSPVKQGVQSTNPVVRAVGLGGRVQVR